MLDTILQIKLTMWLTRKWRYTLLFRGSILLNDESNELKNFFSKKLNPERDPFEPWTFGTCKLSQLSCEYVHERIYARDESTRVYINFNIKRVFYLNFVNVVSRDFLFQYAPRVCNKILRKQIYRETWSARWIWFAVEGEYDLQKRFRVIRRANYTWKSTWEQFEQQKLTETLDFPKPVDYPAISVKHGDPIRRSSRLFQKFDRIDPERFAYLWSNDEIGLAG